MHRAKFHQDPIQVPEFHQRVLNPVSIICGLGVVGAGWACRAVGHHDFLVQGFRVQRL